MTRRGKIARLPQPVRDQINQRLQNDEEGEQIAERLNTLPEVRSLMAAEFTKKFEHQAAIQKDKMHPQVRGPRPEAGISKETIAQLEKKLNLF